MVREGVFYKRYTLQQGARETLIELFDRAFVETQEAVGMRVLGQFRNPARMTAANITAT
jgi:hypothetical protein